MLTTHLGAFGRVQKCQKKSTGEFRAVKIIDKLNMGEQERVRLKYEIDILKNLNHPNIVSYKESFLGNNSLIIVMEYCEVGDLAYHIKRKQQ